MKRFALASVLLLAVACWPATSEGPAPATEQVRLNGHTFTLPAGFEIELVAGPPLVNRPIVADFDEQGRLHVADSSGSNEPVAIQLVKKPHRIVRLEDSDGDGRFDKSTVYADRMMFPEGVLWRAGSLYVAAAPSIWKLTDKDGDGIAEQREEWFQGKTLTGCANDLHGPYLGPDGWIYWCKGAFARQTYERPGRKPFVTRAAQIFRCRPDGSGIEPVMTGGMDNPVEVVFTPGGERIFTTTFFQHPGGGRRDGLVHAVYGGIYGKDHDVIYEHPWTGPTLMPVLTHFGPAAPCGLTRYESGAFGPEYRDNLFACQFNMRKVSRHVLTPDGATFRCRDEDFVVSDNHDFHPTDVLEDADGSLLILDTGGWYKLCCPTSQLVKPDVLGAIYRVRKKGMRKIDDPRGLKIEWAKLNAGDLVKRLDDPRPAVRRRAIETLAAKGEAVLPALGGTISTEARRNAVWTACRIDSAAARTQVRAALQDADETNRQVAIHAVSLWRNRDAVRPLIALLKSPALHNRRAAAEALGRIGDSSAVPALLEALAAKTDRVLEHSLTYALIEIGDRDRTLSGLSHVNPNVQRAALVALDQMDGGKLEVQRVAAHLNSPNATLRETAAWIAGRHPEWGGALAGWFRDRLHAQLPEGERQELAGRLAKLASNDAIQTLLADTLRDAAGTPVAARTAVQAMARAGLKKSPDSWHLALVDALKEMDSDLVRETIAAARVLPPLKGSTLANTLVHLGKDEKQPEAVRLVALAAVPAGMLQLDDRLFRLLLVRLDREQSVSVRSTAAEVLSRATLTSEQLVKLAGALESTGPMEVSKLLEAFARSTDEKVGLALVVALNNPTIRSGQRTEVVKPKLEKYGPAVQKEAAKLYAVLDAALTQQRAKLEGLLTSLKNGDLRRGQLVFNSAKASCVACHKIGYVGGDFGPDLTHVGKIRSERDLLEAVVFPSSSFVRSYEPVIVATKEGKTYNGVIRKDTADELVLAVAANQEVRLPREDIEEVQPSKVSIMPAGLDQQLTRQELADLIAFLKACQ